MTNENFCSAIDWLENEGMENPAALGRWGIEEAIELAYPGGILAFLQFERSCLTEGESYDRVWE